MNHVAWHFMTVVEAQTRSRHIAHGTVEGYNKGCRDECCATPKREYQQQMRAAKRAAGISGRVRLAQHGTIERYGQNCTCSKCVRAHNIHRRLGQEYPSVRDHAAHLTTVNEPGFAKLWRDILKPDDDISAAIIAKVRARVQKRLSNDFHDSPSGPPTTAAEEISAMSYEQIESLMQPGIPSVAQTRRKVHVMRYRFSVDP